MIQDENLQNLADCFSAWVGDVLIFRVLFFLICLKAAENFTENSASAEFRVAMLFIHTLNKQDITRLAVSRSPDRDCLIHRMVLDIW